MKHQMASEQTRELRVLETLEQEPDLRQVDLAARLDVAVGTANWLLKHLAAKGYVKVKRIGSWRWRYILTPQGIAEKARLTQRYLQDSMQIYRETRHGAQRLIEELHGRGCTQVCLEGKPGNDLVDVCRLTCLEQGIDVVNLGGREVSPTREYEPHTTDPKTSMNPMNHANVPVLRVEGQQLSLEMPEDSDRQ